jgi:hypothetical protein
MKRALTPCPGCRRHVRAGDAMCPFCGSVLDAAPRSPLRVSPRLGSLAKVTFQVALASAALTACGGETSTDTDDKSTGPGNVAGGAGGKAMGGSGGVAGQGPMNDDSLPNTGGTLVIDPPPEPDPVEDAGAPVLIYRATPAN